MGWGFSKWSSECFGRAVAEAGGRGRQPGVRRSREPRQAGALALKPVLFLRGPVPSLRDHCSTSEARCPGRRASEPRPRPASRSPAASQDSCSTSEARCPGCQPGLLRSREPRLRPMLSRHLHVAKARLQPLPKMLFFWIFTCAQPSIRRHVLRLQNIAQFQNARRLDFRAGKRLSAVEVHIISGPLSIRTGPVSDLKLRNSGNSTFKHAKGSLLCESAPFQVLCSLEAVPGLRFSRRVHQAANRRFSRSLLADRSFKKRPSHTRGALKATTGHHLSQLVRSNRSRASSCTFQLVKTPISPAFFHQGPQDHKSTSFDLT